MTSVKDAVDKISRESGLGSLSSAATNNLWGINHRGVGNPIPANKDTHGLTFFTRPRLNLSYDNIAVDRVLTPMLDGQSTANTTYQRAIRVLLDTYGADVNGIDSPLVDNECAFIPLLTNNLISISGWPDVSIETYTSKPGNYKEAWSMVDSTAKIWSTYQLTANFRNIEGDPISSLFNAWAHYMAGVYDGTMVPYPDANDENEIDYDTRIYRVILDPTKRYVQKIGACGAAFPIAAPLGSAFDYSSDSLWNTSADQISIPFMAMGADYLDPILIMEFNTIVCEFNTSMLDAARSDVLTLLKPDELSYFNYRGYPRIDPDTFEMQWWVKNDDYAEFATRRANGTLTKSTAAWPFAASQPTA